MREAQIFFVISAIYVSPHVDPQIGVGLSAVFVLLGLWATWEGK